MLPRESLQVIDDRPIWSFESLASERGNGTATCICLAGHLAVTARPQCGHQCCACVICNICACGACDLKLERPAVRMHTASWTQVAHCGHASALFVRFSYVLSQGCLEEAAQIGLLDRAMVPGVTSK